MPLLDHTLVEFAATIPPELQMQNGERKALFKRAMRGVLPEAVLSRPKRGFAIPLGRWLRGPLAPFVHDLLLSEKSLGRGIFDPGQIRRIVAQPERGQEDLDLQLWTLISIELWCRLFLDRQRMHFLTEMPAALTERRDGRAIWKLYGTRCRVRFRASAKILCTCLDCNHCT